MLTNWLRWIFFYNMPMPFLSCAHAIAHIALVRLRIISTLGKKSAYLTGLLSFILLGWFLQESWWIVCLLDSTKYEDAVDEYPTDNYCFLVAVGSMKSSYESGDSDVEQIIAIFKFTVACAILIEYDTHQSPLSSAAEIWLTRGQIHHLFRLCHRRCCEVIQRRERTNQEEPKTLPTVLPRASHSSGQ